MFKGETIPKDKLYNDRFYNSNQLHGRFEEGEQCASIFISEQSEK